MASALSRMPGALALVFADTDQETCSLYDESQVLSGGAACFPVVCTLGTRALFRQAVLKLGTFTAACLHCSGSASLTLQASQHCGLYNTAYVVPPAIGWSAFNAAASINTAALLALQLLESR